MKLKVLAGAEALRAIRKDGLDYTQIQTLAGASGGAKWLVLSQLDRVIARDLLPRLGAETFLAGSSIGAWRMCAFAQPDPISAIERLEEAYVEQRYEAKPTPREVTAVSLQLAEELIGDQASAILANDRLRLNIVAARCRGPVAAENRLSQGLGLALAAAGNAVTRKAVGLVFERAVFHDPRGRGPFRMTPPMRDHWIPLSPDNLAQAVLASGSIPMVLEGVRDIPGAPPGVYRDGGVTDYHFADAMSDEKGWTLLPHFYPYLIPGWFDKHLKRRRGSPEQLARTILLCPGDEFVSSLPGEAVPTRHDFLNFSTKERLTRWREVLKRCEELAADLSRIIDEDRWANAVEPL